MIGEIWKKKMLQASTVDLFESDSGACGGIGYRCIAE
jgi:hypothetical protein